MASITDPTGRITYCVSLPVAQSCTILQLSSGQWPDRRVETTTRPSRGPRELFAALPVGVPGYQQFAWRRHRGTIGAKSEAEVENCANSAADRATDLPGPEECGQPIESGTGTRSCSATAQYSSSARSRNASAPTRPLSVGGRRVSVEVISRYLDPG